MHVHVATLLSGGMNIFIMINLLLIYLDGVM